MQGWRGLNRVILADFQRVISRFLKDISNYLSCTAQRVLRTIYMQKAKPRYACLPSKIVEVWIDRFCVRYDWWRRLQPTSSVSPVWFFRFRLNASISSHNLLLARDSMPEARSPGIHADRNYHTWILEPSEQIFYWILRNIFFFAMRW